MKRLIMFTVISLMIASAISAAEKRLTPLEPTPYHRNITVGSLLIMSSIAMSRYQSRMSGYSSQRWRTWRSSSIRSRSLRTGRSHSSSGGK